MGIINVLDTQTANLIAAGEVVERPASVVKELMENSVDAGASRITVEIKNGGVSYIRVTDNGCGMTKDDAANCILRHATSKISCPEDLAGISTLGFRGEALAAISSVCRFRLFTKRKDEPIGTLLEFTAGETVSLNETGCPDGTSIIITDLFYNVPARRKFLKKDFSEAMAVSAVVERIAVSHPEVSIQYIIDNKVKYTTKGDGNTDNAIYVALGKQFYETLTPIKASAYTQSVSISGFICKAECGRSNRNMQYMFLNGRSIRSKTVSAALDEGYRTYMPNGNFPTCVLFMDVDVHSVDVNVHPTKQEVKFSSEKSVFDAVYFAVKNTLSDTATHPELAMTPSDSYAQKGEKLISSFVPVTKPEPQNSRVFSYFTDLSSGVVKTENSQAGVFASPKIEENLSFPIKSEYIDIKADDENEKAAELMRAEQKPSYKIIGEAYNCYIFVELSDRVMVIDKHAAHERILYNELISDKVNDSQVLLEPISVSLSHTDMAAVSEYIEDIRKAGFDIEIFGSDSVIIREIPVPIVGCNIEEFITALAGSISEGKGRVIVKNAVYERALFTAACKAAMKGGQHTNGMQNSWVVEKVLSDNAVRYCPHGRPVAYEIKKSSLENQFGR